MSQLFSTIGQWTTNQLRSVRGRYVAGMIFTLGLLGLMKWQQNLVGLLAFLGVSAAAIWSIVARLRALTPLVKTRVLRRFGRFLRATRVVTAMHPAVEALQLTAVLCTFLVMCYLLLTKDIQAVGWTWTTLSALLIVAVVIDIPCQLRAAMRLAWAKTVGKFALGVIGALALILATSEARDIANRLTGVDPKNFPDFQSFAVFILTPAYYVKLVAYVLAVWAMLNLLVGMLSFGFLEFVAVMRSTPKQKKSVLTYRLVNGRRPPRGYAPPSFSWGGFLFFMRNTAIVLAIGYGESTFQRLGIDYRQSVDRAFQSVMVSLDFRSAVSCAGVPVSDRAAYLDRVGILVATSAPTGYTFTKLECPAAGR